MKLYPRMIIIILFIILKNQKQPKCLIVSKQLDKLWYIQKITNKPL